jgi:membrane-bound metal-dependent hydrolase YbcI (DUF457 family)
MLLLATLALAYASHRGLVPTFLFVALVVLGVGAGVGLRAASRPVLREFAAVPVLVVMGVLAGATPVAPVAELLVGGTGVVFVAWLLDDPFRPSAGATRGAVEWAIPALGVGLAWSSSFLLPATAAPVGVAGGLLAAALVVLAYLVRRPELFDRDQGTTI